MATSSNPRPVVPPRRTVCSNNVLPPFPLAMPKCQRPSVPSCSGASSDGSPGKLREFRILHSARTASANALLQKKPAVMRSLAAGDAACVSGSSPHASTTDSTPGSYSSSSLPDSIFMLALIKPGAKAGARTGRLIIEATRGSSAQLYQCSHHRLTSSSDIPHPAAHHVRVKPSRGSVGMDL
ncbi:hypothetical protein K438DRAFT_1988867 [Mycena galopus ATCC 62051]|nr:hypothetical protein K438DRAFT_1988867 [Mycena galopus ATCC 62051]